MTPRISTDIAPQYREYVAWDAPTIWFHWINVLAVLGLIATGLGLLYDDELGFSASGKLLLKSVHVTFGYVMAINLVTRIVRSFYGSRYTGWRGIVPWGPGYLASLRSYMKSLLVKEPQQFVGHNPLARLAVTALFLLLLVQMITGLVLAGTDLYWPPFGQWFAHWVAASGIDPNTLQAGNPDLVDKAAFQGMRAFRKPFVVVHELAFYGLAIGILLHLAGVVFTELHEGGGITSAMFTGRKILTRKPPDAP